MVKTTITISPTTRDCLYRYCKKRKLTYDKGILELLGTEAPKEHMYSVCPFCQEQFDVNQVPRNSKVFPCPKCGETMSIPLEWWP